MTSPRTCSWPSRSSPARPRSAPRPSSPCVLPFLVLAMLVSTNDGFRAFYRTTAGFVVICVGAAMAFVGWKLINAIGRLPDRPAGPGAADEAGTMTGQVLAIALIAAVAAGCLVRSLRAYPGPSRASPGPVHRAGPGPTRHHGAASGRPARRRCGGRW